jgi:hypothetical protein
MLMRQIKKSNSQKEAPVDGTLMLSGMMSEFSAVPPVL